MGASLASTDDVIVQEAVPPVDDTPPEIQRTMTVSTLEGCATTMFLVWTSGAVLTGYLLHLGAGPLELALLGSLPLLAQIIAPVAVLVQGLYPHRRVLTMLSGGIGRGLWLLAVIAPFLFTNPYYAVVMVLLVLAASSMLQSFAGLIWTHWMADVVPVQRRGRYFGLRNGICAVAGVGAQLVAGVLLDSLGAPVKYQLMITLGVLFAALGVWLYGKQYEPPMTKAPAFNLRRLFATPLADQNFRRFMIFVLYWQASVLIAAPFVFPYFLDHLGLSFTTIAIWAALAAVLTLAFGPIWGRIADRSGNKPVLTVTTIIAGTMVPLCWMLATPDNNTFIWLSALFEAVAWSAINPAIFNLTLATANKDDRMSYLAVLSVFAGLAGFLGAIASGFVLEGMKDWSLAIGAYAWTGYHTLFVVSGLLRSFAWKFLAPVAETNAWTALGMLRGMRRFRLTGFIWR